MKIYPTISKPTLIVAGIILFYGFLILASAGLYAGEKKSGYMGRTNRLSGGTEITGRSDVNAVVSYALNNNPGVRAKFDFYRASLKQAEGAGTMPEPKVSYTYFLEEVETRLGPQKQKIGLQQTFPWFGKLSLKEEIAMMDSDLALANYDSARLKLIRDVKVAYYEYNYIGRAINIIENQLRLLEYLEAVILKRYENAVTSYNNLIKLQIMIERVKERLNSFRDIRTSALARLNGLLNRPYDTPLDFPEEVKSVEVRYDEVELIAMLKEKNPQLTALSLRERKEFLRRDLAKKSYLPDFTLGLEYVDIGEPIDFAMPQSGSDAVMLMFSFNLPIKFGAYEASVQEAEFKSNSFKRMWTDVLNNLISDLKQKHWGYKEAERKIGLYKSLIPKAEQSLSITRQSFMAGEATINDLIDDQWLLLEFELSLETAMKEKRQRAADIEMLMAIRLDESSQLPVSAGKREGGKDVISE